MGASETSHSVTKNVQLRIPLDMLERIDTILRDRKPAPSRHFWILEAMQEKMEREDSNMT